MLRIGLQNTDRDKLLEAAGNYLNDALREALLLNKQVLLALSGGSCLDLMSYIDVGVLSNKVTITVLDERFSHDPKINNTAQIISRGFVESIKMKHINFIDLRVREDETQVDLANRFNDVLENWIKNNTNGLILATLGMGIDGHTSGMIPNTPKFQEKFDSSKQDQYVVSYTADNEFPQRVTTTLHFLRLINKGVLLITGEEKRKAFLKLMAKEGALEDTPARIYREIKGEIKYYSNLVDIEE